VPRTNFWKQQSQCVRLCFSADTLTPFSDPADDKGLGQIGDFTLATAVRFSKSYEERASRSLADTLGFAANNGT
jgi:hypothetical protein